MPRTRGIDAPGVVHHVFTHAVDGFGFFVDSEDRRDLLARLGSILPEEGARCFAWALLSNHLHLVVKTGERRLGTVMQRILTGYAMRVNRLGGRRGYLVWSRFGSRPVRDDGDLRNVIRYALWNPLDAGLVGGLDALAGYPWCGLPALLGRRRPLAFESVAETLELFGSDEAAARASLRAWLETRDETPAPGIDGLVRAVCAELDLSHAAVSQAHSRATASDGKGPSPS